MTGRISGPTWLVVFWCLACGCGLAKLEGGDAGIDAPVEPPVDSDAGAPIADAGGGIDADISCVDVVLDTALGEVEVNTEPETDDFTPSCGGEDNADQVFLWTAPVTDYYVFDTFKAGFDTALAMLDRCGGTELACSNNVGQRAQSEVVRKVTQGEQVVLVVDGIAGDRGQGQLAIQRVTCPDTDLEGQSFPRELSTVGFGDDLALACGGEGQEDRAYHWVAPEDGLYYFRATSETFTPVIALIDGPRCTDRMLGCNAGVSGELGAEVVRYLHAGQSVSVVVDGLDGAGLFTLDVGLQDGPTCPEGTIEGEILPGETFTERSLAPSCGFARAYGGFGGAFELQDKTYRYEVPSQGGCFGGCEIIASSQQPLVLYVLEGDDCGGAEVACAVATQESPDQDAPYSATVSVSMEEEARTYTVVVADHADLGTGVFDLETVCYIACP